MSPLPFENTLSRLFRQGQQAQHPADVIQFQAVVRVRPLEIVEPEELEEGAERTLSVLLGGAKDTALGPVVGCDFEQGQIEAEFTVEATSAEDLHRRLGHVVRVLEEQGPFRYHDSTASRLDLDREPVPA